MKTILTALLCITTLSSCRLLFKTMGVLDTNVKLKTIYTGNKEIVFIPMHHIGKQEFYSDVKRINDSLKIESYTIYYEGIKRRETLSSNDINVLKMRKLTGIDFYAMGLNKGYLDSSFAINGRKFKVLEKEKLMNQPSNTKLGIDTLSALRADVFFDEIITAYEEKYGKIALDSCDIQTPSGKKYSCKKIKNKEGRKYAIVHFRDKYITNLILNDTSSKIAITYGANHFKGIVANLKLADPQLRVKE